MSKHIDKSRFPQNPKVGDEFSFSPPLRGFVPPGWVLYGGWVNTTTMEQGVTYRYNGFPAGLYWVRHKDGTVGVVEYEGDGCWQAMGSDNLWRVGEFAAILGPVQSQDQVAALEAIRDEQAETIAEQAKEIDDLQEDLDSTSEVDEAIIEVFKRQVVEQGQRIGERNDMIEALERAVTEIAGERDAATSARHEAKAELYDARQEIKAQERQIREQKAEIANLHQSMDYAITSRNHLIRELKEELNRLKPLKRSNGLFSCWGGA